MLRFRDWSRAISCALVSLAMASQLHAVIPEDSYGHFLGESLFDEATSQTHSHHDATVASELRIASIASVPPNDASEPVLVEPLPGNIESELDSQLPPPPSPDDTFAEPLPGEPLLVEPYYPDEYYWQWAPTGLIWHSYMAGPHEPRMGVVAFQELSEERTLWDATLGGRVGFLRYGNDDPISPIGYQLDFYGAAIARLDVDNQQDLDSTDYVFGLPLTWGDPRLQFKLEYAHISSHLGDEYAISHPGSLGDRINYVRDSVVFGTSYYPHPIWRAYGEIGYAFHTSGGAEPLELQFGSEIARPGPTGGEWIPFFAVNGRMREEHDFGGDIALQTGVLRRGLLNQTLRFGLHYYNGKSSQFQFFRDSEQQVGIGLWYDM